MLPLVLLAAVVMFDAPVADDKQRSDVTDSIHGDFSNPGPAETDTAAVDSVMLEPILYRPGPDTVLISAYRERGEISAGGISPSLTMLKSVAFPGWGQISNGKYLKAGLIMVVESYFIYKAVDYSRLASDWRDKWKAEPDTGGLKGVYFNQYADYRDTRNSFIWYTAITVFFSMIDAYVDAHLKDFPEDIPVSDNLSLSVEPGRETRVAVSYSF